MKKMLFGAILFFGGLKGVLSVTSLIVEFPDNHVNFVEFLFYLFSLITIIGLIICVIEVHKESITKRFSK